MAVESNFVSFASFLEYGEGVSAFANADLLPGEDDADGPSHGSTHCMVVLTSRRLLLLHQAEDGGVTVEDHPRGDCVVAQFRGGAGGDAGDELTIDIQHESGLLRLGFRPWSKDDGDDILVALEGDQRRRAHWTAAAS